MTPLLCLAFLAALEGGRIEGQVYHAVSGEPIAKALVSISADKPLHRGITVQSDGAGRFVFDKLEPGEYRIRGVKTGFLNGDNGSKDGKRPGRPVMVEEKSERKGLEIWLRPAGSIAGRVVDEDADAMEGVEVSAWRRSYQFGKLVWNSITNSRSNAKGEFLLSGLGPGSYYISADAPRHRMGVGLFAVRINDQDWDYPKLFYQGVDLSVDARSIDLGAGQEVRELVFPMRRRPVAKIRGRFAEVKLLRDGAQIGVHRVSNDKGPARAWQAGHYAAINPKSGNFEVDQVFPGDYVLSVVQHDPKGARVVGYTRVSVGDGAVNDVTIETAALGRLSGRIQAEAPKGDAKAISLESLRISVWSDLGVGWPNTHGDSAVAGDGTFAIGDLLPGTYQFSVYSSEGLYQVTRSFAGGVELASRHFESLGSETELSVVVSPNLGSANFVVERAGAEAGVVLLAREGGAEKDYNTYRLIEADARGRLATTGLSPGRYRAYALETIDPDRMTDPAFLKAIENRGAELEVGENETKNVTLKQISASEVEEALRR
jgi:hypothetical protein